MRALPSVILIVIVVGFLFVILRPKSVRAEPLKPGDFAPDFSTQAVHGDQTIQAHLRDYLGRQVILYFYPKDNTPGCTREASAFRDGYAILQQAGIVVFGCSIDSPQSHAKFIKKYNLPFALLLDSDKKIAKAYGADNGIPILGLDKRITYVIGDDGRILKVYPEVDPATNARTIIHDLGADKPRPTPTANASPTSSAAGAYAPIPDPKAAAAAAPKPRPRSAKAPDSADTDDFE